MSYLKTNFIAIDRDDSVLTTSDTGFESYNRLYLNIKDNRLPALTFNSLFVRILKSLKSLNNG